MTLSVRWLCPRVFFFINLYIYIIFCIYKPDKNKVSSNVLVLLREILLLMSIMRSMIRMWPAKPYSRQPGETTSGAKNGQVMVNIKH